MICFIHQIEIPALCFVGLYAGHPYIHLISFEIFLLAFYTTYRFIGVLQQSWDWKELASSHKLLEVCDPDALSGKSNTLTYLQDGRLT